MEKERFNKLSAEQEERLTILIEECAEVIQAATKIKRHGYGSKHPNYPNGLDNKGHLEKEIGDVLCIVDLLFASHEVYSSEVEYWSKEKQKTVFRYTHHQKVNK